jgi:flagellar export protein FliJ
MKKFNFSLENVLRLKISLEENEKMTLGFLKKKENDLQDEYDFIHSVYKKAADELKAYAILGMSSVKYTEYSNYMIDLDKKKAAKQTEIDSVQTKITKQTEVLINIRTEIKALEKLKEKQKILYNSGRNKQNEILIEDFISGRRDLY